MGHSSAEKAASYDVIIGYIDITPGRSVECIALRRLSLGTDWLQRPMPIIGRK
jgi:hypothetical protein